jgi:amino acid adenylation domain-containing protein
VRGPVVRALLLQLAAEEHQLLFTLHHIAGDGWSLGVLIRELQALYGAFTGGRPSPLSELPLQYSDYALWQRQWLSGEVLAGEIAYWRERLSGSPALLELPVDRQRPAVRSGRAGQLPFRLAPAAVGALRGWAAGQRATLFMAALAAFAALLSRLTGGEDLPIGAPIAGRAQRGVEGLIGFFVNTLVLRVDASGDPSFGELLERVRTSTLDAYSHPDLPFERLVEELAPERSLAHSPLFQVTVNFQNVPLGRLTLPGLEIETIEVDSERGKFDLAFILAPGPDDIQGTLRYSRDLFDHSTLRRFLDQLERLLVASVTLPERGIAALPLLGAAERHQLVAEWNDTAAAVGDEKASLHALFVTQSERVPDTVALVCEEEWVTFGELARRSGRLAGRLRALGVGPESRVAICAERSLAMMVGLLGILRAGGFYVALDPSHPPERLAQLLADVQSDVVEPVLLVQAHLAERLPERPGHRIVLEDQKSLDGVSAPEDLASPANAAYMIFTSGSTGRPKGVVVEHRQMIHYLHGISTAMGITGERSFALVQLITVDASKTLIFPPLARGGTLHLITKERGLAPGALAAYLRRHRIHGTKIAPSHLTALQADCQTADLLPEGWLIFGGEASRPEWAEDLAAARPSCRVFNHYGPTETTVGVMACEIKAGLAIGPSRTTHLGRLLPNTRIHLLDRFGQPVPPGISGEIYVGGPYVTRGYHGRPELTAERYVPDALGPEPGARLYRTGDLARLFADGQVEFLGRLDDQLKIRGFRVELGEIAVELGRHPGLRSAVVLAPAGPGGTRRLVAYVVPRESRPSPADLRRFLSERLPEYMVPQAYAFLEALPRSTHGKVDRRALAAIPLEVEEETESYQAPRTPTEELLAGIWGEVLKVDRVGTEDDFFALGGHSLLAVQVVSRIREAFGVELALRQIFEFPTISGLATAIVGEQPTAGRVPPLLRQARPGEIPLSFAQERLWFLEQLDPDSGVYNIQLPVRLEGELKIAVLAAVLGEIVRRHEALRTTFPAVAGRPRQAIAPSLGLAPPVVDLARLPAAARRGETSRLAAADAALPFDLARGPLLRATLLLLAADEQILLLDLHHIVSDGWSTGVLIREVAALYPAFLAGHHSPLPPLAVQYADFALWQRGWLTGELLAGEIAWWRQALAGQSPFELPTDYPRPPQPSGRGALHRFVLERGAASALSRLALASGATLYMTLLAGLAAVLTRWSGEESLAVGSPVANRDREELEPLIGFFVNTLVLRVDLAGDPSPATLLDQVRRTALAAYAHQDLPFEKLVEVLSPERDASRAPLFQVLLTLQNTPREALELPGLRLTPLELDRESAKFDLTLAVEETPKGLACAWEYSLDLFDRVTVVRLADHLERLLAGATVDPRCPWSLLPLLSAGERHQILAEWNDTALAWPPEPLVHELFSRQARHRPAATVIAGVEGRLTYGQVEARSNRLAHHLRDLGVGPEVLVAICMERALERVVAIVGVLKAGGAYVPLDATYPPERLAFVLADTGAPVLVTEQELTGRLPATAATVVSLSGQWDEVPGEERWAPETGVGPENLAYVVYTSGSTGRPKGVEVRHAGLSNLVRSYQELYDLRAEDRGTVTSSPAFDASVWELWPYLVAGASVHVPEEEVRLSPTGMVRWWSEEGITLAYLVTPLAEAVLAEEETRRVPLRLRVLTTAGDRLHRGPSPGIGFRLMNHYGPSEYTVASTVAEVRERHQAAGRMPAIGRPLANTRIVVLDRHLQLAPVGVPGELCVSGTGLARGYLKRPDLTAEKFLPAPLALGGEPGERLYRTGDLVRWLPGGELDFLGRTDSQVKIRGFRIELGEIEAILNLHPEVRQAALLVREDAPGDRRLVAYVVPREEPGPRAAELRSFLRDKLPEPMIPVAIVLLATLPVTANGKLDRRSLPAPPADRREEGLAYAAPESAAQRLIARIWTEVLGIEKVGLDDNFFELGGHSLLLAQVQGRLKLAIDPAPSMVDLFRFPTVRTLAAHFQPGMATESAPARGYGHLRAKMRTAASTNASTDGLPPIAIIGMAGRFPGAAHPGELWRNLAAGVESIRFYSEEELRAAGVSPELLAHPDYVRARGDLAGVELFDAPFFGYSPREAEILDPQQRIFLECAWEALEDAGYDPEAYPGAIGLFAGAGMSSYLVNLYSRPDFVASVGEYQTQLGNDKDFLVTRVSYKLNLRGPSVGVQTACSTSLVAVHLACSSLRNGECDMALAGGVTIAAAQTGYLYREGGIHSPDGHCRAFDAAGRGTVGGSGAGIVVLKPLGRALADGDSIYAVIRGSAINNDGSSKVGFTAPSVEGQAAVIAEAQAVAGVEPESIGYIEAHGTGTTLGDPIEVAALSQVLSQSGKRGFCALGSLKTNLGHLDAAAGVAGLIKTALVLRHGQIPASLNFTVPNPQIDFANGPLYVNTELRDWPATNSPRRAGVSAFGIGGTNAHVVLEEAPRAAPAAAARPAEILLLSARSAEALEVATDNLARHLETHPDLDLADVAYTLQTGRHSFDHRRMLVGRNTADTIAVLKKRDPERLLSSVAEGRERSVVFLLPGQGAQHVNMGLDLYREEPTFRAQIDLCAELLAPRLGYDLRKVLYPAAANEETTQLMRQPDVSNPALFAVETALALLWRERGITPRAMIGYSFGEYVAAYLAGVFTLEDALDLVVDRAAMLRSLAPGAMLAVPLAEEELKPLLSEGLSLAAVNGPAVCVAAGPPGGIAELERELAGRGVSCRPVPMLYAAHSSMLDPLIEPYAERVARVPRSAPRIPYISNTTGTWVRPEQATDPHEWARHLRLPVRFAAGLQTICEDPDAVLLEVGPGRGLSALARLNGAGARTIVSSMRHPREETTDVEALLAAEGRLWLSGLAVDWQGIHRQEDGRRRRVALPTYPFERRRYWVDRNVSPWRAAGSRRDPTPSPVTIEWEPGMSPLEIGEMLARVLASGQSQVVVSRRAQTAAAEGPGESTSGEGTTAASHGRPAMGTTYMAPTGPLEEQLVTLWEDLLGISGIGVHDNFYELGGHSLLATMVISRVREQLGISVPLEDFFAAPTIASLGGLVAQAQVDQLEEGELAQLLSEVQGLPEEELQSLLAAEASSLRQGEP